MASKRTKSSTTKNVQPKEVEADDTEAESESEVEKGSASAADSAASESGVGVASSTSATDADADADADAAAGKAQSRAAASPRAVSGDHRSQTSNVNIVIVPDSSAPLVGLVLALLQNDGSNRDVPASVAKLLQAVLDRQKESHEQLIEALRALVPQKE